MQPNNETASTEMVLSCTSVSSKRKTFEPLSKHIAKKARRSSPNIMDLPDEMLLAIFSLLPGSVLYGIGPVCKRWNSLRNHPALWKKLKLNGSMTSNFVKKIIFKMAATLKHLVIRNRKDLNFILGKVIAKKCNNLEVLEMDRCQGSMLEARICPRALCRAASKCSKLGTIRLNHTRFRFCKFFRLLLTKKPNASIRVCEYKGILSSRQLNFLESAKIPRLVISDKRKHQIL